MSLRWKSVLVSMCLLLMSTFVFSIVGAQDDASEDVTVRLAWWGNQPRHDLYAELSDLYEDLNPEVTLEREFNSWPAYWELLPTQVAGNNMPDIVHMHPSFVNEYASRGALLDLTPYIESGELDLSSFPEGVVNSGMIDGEIVMISLGNSSPGIHYNVDYFEEAGIEFDPYSWSWDEYLEIARELQSVMPEGAWPSADLGMSDIALEIFLRQRGKDFFVDEEIGFTPEDLTDFWSMMEMMRSEGLIPPTDISQEFDDVAHADSLLANGRVAMEVNSGNQHILYQNATDAELNLAVLPRTVSEDGEIEHGDIIDGAYISCAAETEYVQQCIDYINWMVNDPEVAVIYNGEHGPPGNSENAELIAVDLEPANQRMFAMMAAVSPHAFPRGQRAEWGTEAGDALQRIYAELAFGNLTVEEAVDRFFEEIDFIAS